MTDLNNINLGNKNVHGSFKRDKKNEVKNIPSVDSVQSENVAQPADSYGRVLVSKTDNPEMVKCVKDSLDKLMENPAVVRAAIKASDDAYEILSADDVPFAYEKSCCGACDAALEILQ